MSVKSRRERFETLIISRIRRYSWYAVGEIVLIFAGITLALWFSNWNEQLQLQALEKKTLEDIAENLDANIEHISANIDADNIRIDACERVLRVLSDRKAWNDSMSRDLYICRWWTSPYLSSAAYESLKVRGIELISDSELRKGIINLYEQTYAFLVNDTDKTFWNFQTAVMEPVFNQYVRMLGPDRFVPNDYEQLLTSDEFMNMLAMKLGYQKFSVLTQTETLEATETVVAAIEHQLHPQVQ